MLAWLIGAGVAAGSDEISITPTGVLTTATLRAPLRLIAISLEITELEHELTETDGVGAGDPRRDHAERTAAIARVRLEGLRRESKLLLGEIEQRIRDYA